MWSGLDEQLIAHGAEGLDGNVEGGLEPNSKLAQKPEARESRALSLPSKRTGIQDVPAAGCW